MSPISRSRQKPVASDVQVAKRLDLDVEVRAEHRHFGDCQRLDAVRVVGGSSFEDTILNRPGFRGGSGVPRVPWSRVVGFLGHGDG